MATTKKTPKLPQRRPAQPRPRRIRFGEYLIPYDDAPENITVQRTAADILKATPGSDGECMNSRCIQAQRNAHIFPHPVYMVSTIKSRIFIVDRLDDSGEPAHAVRYQLGKKDGRLIDRHDSAQLAEPGELILRRPYDPKGSPVRAATRGARFGTLPKGTRHSGDGRHDRVNPSPRPITAVPRGAAARVVVAVGAAKRAAG